jgi:hypothetical protein
MPLLDVLIHLAWRSAGVADVVIDDIRRFLLAVSSGGPNESKAAGAANKIRTIAATAIVETPPLLLSSPSPESLPMP